MKQINSNVLNSWDGRSMQRSFPYIIGEEGSVLGDVVEVLGLQPVPGEPVPHPDLSEIPKPSATCPAREVCRLFDDK